MMRERESRKNIYSYLYSWLDNAEQIDMQSGDTAFALQLANADLHKPIENSQFELLIFVQTTASMPPLLLHYCQTLAFACTFVTLRFAIAACDWLSISKLAMLCLYQFHVHFTVCE